MKHIAGWFRRNNTIMAQAKDLARQLQEAWDKASHWKSIAHELDDMHECAIEQLHRVARERYEESEKRLEAEKDKEFDILALRDSLQAANNWEYCYKAERELRLAAEDRLLDSYLRIHERAEEDFAAERYYNEEE